MFDKNCGSCSKAFHCMSSLEELTKGREPTKKDVDISCEWWGGYEREDYSKYRTQKRG